MRTATCLAREHLGIDGEARLVEHGRRLDVLALLGGEHAVGHRGEPDVGIEPDLMARVPRHHGAAARLRQVADEQPRPAVVLLGLGGEPLNEAHELGMAPGAVARQAHRLPFGAGVGQLHAAREAALGVPADGARRERGGGLDRAEQHFGGRALFLLLLGGLDALLAVLVVRLGARLLGGILLGVRLSGCTGTAFTAGAGTAPRRTSTGAGALTLGSAARRPAGTASTARAGIRPSETVSVMKTG